MVKKNLLVAVAVLALIVFAVSVRAQSASAVFNGPRNMDAGLQNGLNNLTGYVTFLPLGAKAFEAKGVAASNNPRIKWLDGRLPDGPKGSDWEACQ
jgi:hypothetical protein